MFGVLRTTVLSPRKNFAQNAMVFEHCADSVLRSSFDRLALAWFERFDRLALAWFERFDRLALAWFERFDRLALAWFERFDRLALAWFERAAPRGRLEEVLKDRVALPGVELLDR